MSYRNDSSSDNGFSVVGSVSGTGISFGTPVTFNSGSSSTNEITSTFDSSNNKVVIAYQDGNNSSYGTAIVGTVDPSDNSISFGTEAVFQSANTQVISSTFDSSNNKVVIAYKDAGNSDYGTAIVGTVSGTSISFGTPTVFTSGTFNNSSSAFDSSAGKVVIAYRDGANSNYGTAIVGTVSGTSISFGSSAVFESSTIEQTAAAYDTNAGKVVIAYRDDTNAYSGTAVVATVSGTSISFGTPVVFNSGASGDYTVVYNSDAQNIIIAYRKDSDTSGQAVVGTVSGTSISFGSTNEFTTNNLNYVEAAYDTNSATIVITYQDSIQSSHLYVVVGSPSGNSITFGTPVVVNSASTIYPWIAYHAAAKKVVISYIDETSSSNHGKFRVGTVSGTSITLATASTFASASTNLTNIIYDPDTEKMVVNYRDTTDSNKGKATVFSIDYSTPNLTSENYIGMSRGVVDFSAQSISSLVQFDSDQVNQIGTAYDANAQKVVIVYRDAGNSNQGTAIVGTVANNSITYGTAVVYETGNSQYNQAVYMPDKQKVFISYRDITNGNAGMGIVGTVSGTSISFGSPSEFASSADYISCTYDTNSQKVVVSYRDANNSSYGTSRVATITDSTISYGTAAVFQSSNTFEINSAYDTNAQKVVIAYSDATNSQHGKAVVATVSGTSISFGSSTTFESASSVNISMDYDASAQKVVIAYMDEGNSDVGTAIVGTVSGTSISFGTPVVYNTGRTPSCSVVYNPDIQKTSISYKDQGNSSYGTYIEGTVSGTSITFGNASVFNTDESVEISAVYDTDQDRTVVAFMDGATSPYTGQSVVVKSESTTRGQITNGQAASIDIIGSVSDNQLSLTAGQQYYVQTDGTISTTADSPSVLAGTAISATERVVKT